MSFVCGYESLAVTPRLYVVTDIDFMPKWKGVKPLDWRRFLVGRNEADPSRGVYGISVAASLVGNAPQNLRLYEARGLVSPARSDGGTRLYSENDLERLRLISELLDNGLNLAGIHMVLGLQEANERLQGELDERIASTDESSGPIDPP
jgi:MerR family transcriptional regulator, heat shock protein HspR